jgi:uncharacterized protein (DUF2141 family)
MKIKFYFSLFIIFGALHTSWGQTASLEVKVNNIKSQTGTIRVGLFTNEKDFLKNAVKGKVVKPEGNCFRESGTRRICVECDT